MSAPATTEAKPAAPAAAPAPPLPSDKIKIKVDGREIEVPKMMPNWQGKMEPTTMLQACQLAAHEVPHYCYHPKLPVAGNCRMCLVEFGTPQMGPDRKPVLNEDGSPKIAKSVLPYEPGTPRGAIACATPISPGMEIYPNSPATKQMREAVLESLLINHPLDCPICDQAGECKLQEYSVEHGQAQSRFVEAKVHKPKAVDLGPRIVLDDERCILCTRCIRFTKDIAGDDALGIVNRGSYNTIAAWAEGKFDNNYTLNTVDICPVGALTSKDFRFQMRVWFMKETKSLCTSCGTGCNIIVGSREEKVYRYEPRQNDAVNSMWMCDSGRLNYKWIGRTDRLQKCGMRIAERGMLEVAWPTALKAVSAKLASAPTGSVAVIASARQTTEELFLLAKLAKRFNALTDSVARNGEGDKLLVNADKNPNSNGARLTGIAGPQLGVNLAKIADGIRSGSIRTLIVFGEDVTKHGIGADLLAKLDTLIVSDILPNATTAAAHFVLPGCAHVEKRGTFVNVKGRVQKFMKAVEAPGDARPEWEFLHELVHNVTGQNGFSTIEGLFNQMAREVPGFAGLEWAKLGDTGVTVQI
ncbi:MAG: NADH-quinone oxidoreductase subunit L [Verrucomicrobia bacterium]|nr:NADH-quinone oxidoreductase subunit L [Verrucomicrobiota bacterium]NBU08326.1 NADH-quinone oxidoreductase subunit L [Pseudomonadota bacterium]NDA65188.1 NADH-quinone oxidoreductase subunit L [Verrucomicrobiota bacterium]NDD38177.1 NADH-quinone oxidoreductase subunit L [Verrucomicrobiota bacterium]NDE98330.1 NADH-quinone oxidoreductase subunit L [Verrucomicrobiota bacterium]